MEKILKERLFGFSTINNLIIESRQGFRKYRSPTAYQFELFVGLV